MAGPSSPGGAPPVVAIANVVTDPVWSLQPWSLDVVIGSVSGTIPALPATPWLALLFEPELVLWDIIPGLCPEIEDPLMEALTQGHAEFSEVKTVALDVISMVGGRPWWFTLRLLGAIRASWEVVGGELALKGVDSGRISLSAWIDAALLICLRNMDPGKITMFMSQLEAPPPNEPAAEPEMNRSAFLAMG